MILCGLLSSVLLFGKTFDLVILNGRVVDGTGAPAFHADIGIHKGKITEIGGLADARSQHRLDAAGLVVAPGFIDVHTHAEDITELPEGENFLRMGVTTILMGNCGASGLDLAKSLDRVEKARPALNVASLIGHNTVRRSAMKGVFDRPPTPEELDGMAELIERGMEDGAFGLSTGLIYLPGTFSKTDEIIHLAKTASKHGGIYVSHMRDEGLEIDSALEEIFRIAREAKIRAHISHIKLSGKSAWGRAHEILRQIEQARASGLDITQDQYVYTASSTGISQLVPEWAREGIGLSARLKDPQEKQRIRDEMLARLKRRGQHDFAYAVIANCAEDKSLNGLNIVEATQQRFRDASLASQIELILQLVSKGSPSGVFHGMSEEDLRVFLRHPNTMFASDSGVRKFNEGVPHPRGYGNNARVLGLYSREEKLLPLEEAVRRMTSLPASAFRFKGRGQIQEGFWGDLVIFDPETIQEKTTYTAPHQYPIGIHFVLVNGTPVIVDGQKTRARPGKVIRYNRQ